MAAFCSFRLGEYLFGIDVLQVQEVLREQRMTAVPLAADIVEGLINLRGEVVAAVDLRRRMGLEPLPDGQERMNIVVRTEGGVVSFLVDEIGDVVEVTDRALESPPPNLRSVARELLAGVTATAGGLMLVLDVEAAAHPSDSQATPAA